MAPIDLSRKNSKSHVLLAACGRENFALEDPKTKRGLFTHYLLKVLEREDIGNLTYVSLMHKLKMPERWVLKPSSFWSVKIYLLYL